MKVGYGEGICFRCGRKLKRKRPITVAVCCCWEYCPNDHGRGAFGTRTEAYIPDVSVSVYGPITSKGAPHGDLKHPIKILRKCAICGYHSAQEPVEVKLV